MSKTLSTRMGAKRNGNVITETVQFLKKEVGAVENKLREEARAIAIRSAITGGAIGLVIGIVGSALWEKYMTPPTTVQRPPI